MIFIRQVLAFVCYLLCFRQAFRLQSNIRNELNQSNLMIFSSRNENVIHVMSLAKWFFYRLRAPHSRQHFTNELQLYVAHKTFVRSFFPVSLRF